MCDEEERERLSMESCDNTFVSLRIFISDPVRNPSDVFVSFITLPLFSRVRFPLREDTTFHFKAESASTTS